MHYIDIEQNKKIYKKMTAKKHKSLCKQKYKSKNDHNIKEE